MDAVTAKDYWTDRYARQGPTYVARGGDPDSYADQVAALTPILQPLLPDGGRVLDFGCGPGRFREILERGREYVGVDLIEGLGTEPLGDELAEAAFDCVVAIMVLQHIVNDDDFSHWVGEIRRSLREGGEFIVVDHQPMEDPDAHMLPRGMFGVMGAASWKAVRFVTEYDGHWVGVFET